MKLTFPVITFLSLLTFLAKAQKSNPFASIGKKAEVHTLSNGRYTETFDDDVLQRVGTVIIDRRTKKIVSMLDADSVNNEMSDNSAASRWYSIDPLAEKYYSISPYVFCVNNPILFVDHDGRAPTPPDEYVFNEGGNYVRTDKKPGEDKLVIENSKTGKKTDYSFNDPKTDVAAINYNIKWFGSDFKNMKFVFTLSKGNINDIMMESGVKPMNMFSRAWFISTESNGGKMDFSVYHLSTVLAKAGEGKTWDWGAEIAKDKGPLFIIDNERTAYNLFDTGNWLWGNAVNRLGGTSVNARDWSTWFNSEDSQADQNAIQDGWFHQEGYRDIKDCPENR